MHCDNRSWTATWNRRVQWLQISISSNFSLLF